MSPSARYSCCAEGHDSPSTAIRTCTGKSVKTALLHVGKDDVSWVNQVQDRHKLQLAVDTVMKSSVLYKMGKVVTIWANITFYETFLSPGTRHDIPCSAQRFRELLDNPYSNSTGVLLRGDVADAILSCGSSNMRRFPWQRRRGLIRYTATCYFRSTKSPSLSLPHTKSRPLLAPITAFLEHTLVIWCLFGDWF